LTGAGAFDSFPFVFLLQRLLLVFASRNDWLVVCFDIISAQAKNFTGAMSGQ
jgi:hypothetical protein